MMYIKTKIECPLCGNYPAFKHDESYLHTHTRKRLVSIFHCPSCQQWFRIKNTTGKIFKSDKFSVWVNALEFDEKDYSLLRRLAKEEAKILTEERGEA